MEISVYEHRMTSDAFNAFMEQIYDKALCHRASDLSNYGIIDPQELDMAVQRSIQVCRATMTPIRQHFKTVYVCDNEKIVCDWYLSDLGRKLVVLNANPSNPLVANLQLKFVTQPV